MNLSEFSNRYQEQHDLTLQKSFAIDLEAMDAYNKMRAKDSEKFAIATMDEQKTFTEEELKSDQLFKEATQIVSMHLGELIDGTDEELSKKGLQLVSDLTIPTTTVDGKGMLGTYKKFQDAPVDVKQALWYMIDSVDKKDITAAGLVRGLKSLGKSPSDFAGLIGSAGYSFFGRKALDSIAKQTMKDMLYTSAVTGAYVASDEYLRQGLKDKGYDYEKIAEQAGLGAGFGAILSVGIPAAAKTFGWSGHQVMSAFDKITKGDKVDNATLNKVIEAYHGTNADVFQVFDEAKQASQSGNTRGKGFYFATDKGVTETYGGRTLKANLNIENPMVLDSNNKLYADELAKYKETHGSQAGFFDYFTDVAKKQGYDSFVINKLNDDNQVYQEISVFDTNKIQITDQNVNRKTK